MTKEDFQGIIDRIKVETEKNMFSKMICDLSEEISNEEQFLDVDKCLERMQSSAGFDDPQLVAGFMTANNNRNRRMFVNRTYAAINYV